MALAPERRLSPPLTIAREDREYLVRLLLDSLKASPRGGEPTPVAAAPPGCHREVNAAVCVSLYAPGCERAFTLARAPDLASSVRSAAGRLNARAGFRRAWAERLDEARVRIDIVTEQVELSPHAREQFFVMGVGRPVGLALMHEGRLHVLLPADVAGPRVGGTDRMLSALTREAGLRSGAWRFRSVRVSMIRAISFVNVQPGGASCVEIPSGLPVVREWGPALLRRSLQLAAGYLTDRWAEGGGKPPPEARDVASGMEFPLGAGDAGLRRDARCAAALARVAARRPDDRALAVCSVVVRAAGDRARVPQAWPATAFVSCGEAGSPAQLADTVAALELCCAFRQAFGEKGVDDLIRRFALFLLLTQRADGAFHAGHDEAAEGPVLDADGRPLIAGQPATADAARSLLLAFKALDMPECLLGAQKALLWLARADEPLLGPAAARRFVVAAWEYATVAPADPFMARTAEAVDALARHQLSDRTAPAADLIGGSAHQMPPLVGDTAADLEAFAAGARIAAAEGATQLHDRCREAARSAARYVMQFQYTALNGYYLRDPSRARGGLRRRPGSNLVPVESVARAVDALNLLTQLLESVPREDP